MGSGVTPEQALLSRGTLLTAPSNTPGGHSGTPTPHQPPIVAGAAPLTLLQHKSTTKPGFESCSSPGTSNEGSDEQEAMG